MVPLSATSFCWLPALHGAPVLTLVLPLSAPSSCSWMPLLTSCFWCSVYLSPWTSVSSRSWRPCRLPTPGCSVLSTVLLSALLLVTLSAMLLILLPAPFLVLPLTPCFGAPVGHPCTWCPFRPPFLVPLSAPAPGARLSGCSQTAWHPNTNNGLGIGAWGAGLIV